MEFASIKRPLIISAVLAGALAACGWYFDAMVIAMVCLLATVWQVLRVLYYALRRNWKNVSLCGIRFVLWAVAMSSSVAAHNHYLRMTKSRADALVAALQTYRAREGRYPTALDALVPRDIAAVPVAALVPSKVQPFRYRTLGAAGEQYTLTYYPGFLVSRVYDSTTAKWEVRD